MKKQIDVEVLDNLLKKRSSTSIFLEALIEISPCKVGFARFFIIAFVSLMPSILMAWKIDTIPLFLKAVEIFNTVTIGLFGIVFMGYAFFQALINDDLLIRLLNTKINGNDKESKLQESNEYFAKVMMLYIVEIIINILILITLGSVGDYFYLPFLKNSVNNTIAFFLIGAYLNFALNVVWEMKSFVFNLFQLFNSHAATKAFELMKKDSENGVEKE